VKVSGNTVAPDRFWQHADLLTRVTSNGVLVTNWEALEWVIEDSLGNWSFGLPLSPHQVWKQTVHFSQRSSFDDRDLIKVRIPVPLNSPIQTNVHGFPLVIDRFNSPGFSVALEINRSDLRLSFVSVQGSDGTPMRTTGGNWNRTRFAWMVDAVPRGAKEIEVTAAIHKNVAVELFVKPTLVEQTKANP
jgi:hypothetical protein